MINFESQTCTIIGLCEDGLFCTKKQMASTEYEDWSFFTIEVHASKIVSAQIFKKTLVRNMSSCIPF